MKPEDNGVEVSSIRRTKVSGVFIELGPTITSNGTVKGQLGKEALVSRLEPMFILEIRDLAAS